MKVLKMDFKKEEKTGNVSSISNGLNILCTVIILPVLSAIYMSLIVFITIKVFLIQVINLVSTHILGKD